ncbi:MAG: hypothetical protein CMF60_07555 [Magnetococcales bacterium]|nr:hypothetical protein [Magnetococcales bacterium]|tara:strand:- start:3791 stop:4174 length:384 start_codon:yes stop_codon:yes gene_type:complete
MHQVLSFLLPHVFFLFVLFTIPSQYALYILVAFYVVGIFLNVKKDKQHQQALSESKKQSTGDWWEVLGTSPTASVSECARVRKLLTKIYHPDGGQAPNASHMQRINHAYEERSKLAEKIGQFATVQH